LSDYDRFEASVKDRDENTGRRHRRRQRGVGSQNIKNTDTRITARWQHSADRCSNDALFTYEDAFYTKVG